MAAFFLPSNISELVKLRYRLLYGLESFDFDATFLEQRVKHNVITDFAIENMDPYEPSVYQYQYGDPDEYEIPTVHYPLALFRLFPSLEELLLSHGGDMTIAKLELLADTSPGLKSLHLPSTIWSIDASDLLETAPGGPSPFETQLLTTLDRLVHLERVDLGILPFSTDRPRNAFGRWAQGRGIRLGISWPEDRHGKINPYRIYIDFDYDADEFDTDWEAETTPSGSPLLS